MTTVTKRIQTKHNVWTFDVSIPPTGERKVVRIYGDVTNRAHLNEAIGQLTDELDAEDEGKAAKKIKPLSYKV